MSVSRNFVLRVEQFMENLHRWNTLAPHAWFSYNIDIMNIYHGHASIYNRHTSINVRIDTTIRPFTYCSSVMLFFSLDK